MEVGEDARTWCEGAERGALLVVTAVMRLLMAGDSGCMVWKLNSAINRCTGAVLLTDRL